MGLFPTDAVNGQQVTNTRGTVFEYNAAGNYWFVVFITDVYTQAQVDALLHTRLHIITDILDHSATNHRLFYSDGAGHVIELAFGADGTVLTSTGIATAPAFEAAAGGNGGITYSPPLHFNASSGWSEDGWYWFISHSATGESIYAIYICNETGTYYVDIAHYSTGAPRTDLGTISVGAYTHGEAISRTNLLDAEAMSLVNAAANICYIKSSTSSFALTKGDIVSVKWSKTNNVGANSLVIEGIYLRIT